MRRDERKRKEKEKKKNGRTEKDSCDGMKPGPWCCKFGDGTIDETCEAGLN